MTCPELYEEETREALGADTDIFVWSDTDGFLGAVQTANRSYHLDHMTIGVNDAVRAARLAFETIVASGPNSSRPHYTGGDRVIIDHDVIVLDFGCRYHGFCSDTSRTVFVGEPTDKQRKVYEIVLQATLAGEQTARGVIKAAGYGANFLNRTGHGIGMANHEVPYIKEGNPTILQEGIVFSVEDIVPIDGGKAEVLNTSHNDMVVL